MPSPLSHQSYKAKLRYIESLRKVYGKGRKRKSPIALPDLKCPSAAAPISNNIRVKFSSEPHTGGMHKDAKQYPVANNHKQGYEMITPGTIAAGHLKHMNGKKT